MQSWGAGVLFSLPSTSFRVLWTLLLHRTLSRQHERCTPPPPSTSEVRTDLVERREEAMEGRWSGTWELPCQVPGKV